MVGIINLILNWTLSAVVAGCQQFERSQTYNEIDKLLYTCCPGHRGYLLDETQIVCRKACDYRVTDTCVKALLVMTSPLCSVRVVHPRQLLLLTQLKHLLLTQKSAVLSCLEMDA